MPYIQDTLDAEGRPTLIIISKSASKALMDELAQMGKSPGPDEIAIELPFAYLQEYALTVLPKAINAELAKQASG